MMKNDNLLFDISGMQEQDIASLAELERQSFSSPWSEEAFTSELSNDRALFLVAKAQNKVLGYIGSHLIAGECYVTNVAVFKQYRRMGVAGRLLKELFIILKDKNAEFISLEVRESNTPAISLYEKNGFKLMGTIKNMYEKPLEDALIYTLIINRSN